MHPIARSLKGARKGVNSSPPSAAYMRQLMGSALVPITAWSRISVNAVLLLIGILGTNFSEILIKIQKFHSRKCIWKHRLRNGGHFISGGDDLNDGIVNTVVACELRSKILMPCFPNPSFLFTDLTTCTNTVLGKEYIGFESHTYTDRVCQRWDSHVRISFKLIDWSFLSL